MVALTGYFFSNKQKPSSNEAAAGESARNGYKSAQPTTNKNSNIINNSACNQNNGSSEVDPCIPNLDPVNQGKYKHSPDAVAEQSSSNIAQLEPRQRSPQSYSSSRAQSPCLSKQEVLAGGQNIGKLVSLHPVEIHQGGGTHTHKSMFNTGRAMACLWQTTLVRYSKTVVLDFT